MALETSRASEFDPDEYRMTVGEHLEELRRRVLIGLGGFLLAFVVCLVFGDEVVLAFCAPLFRTLQEKDLNPQLYYNQLGDGFGVYIKVAMISAAAVASPWLILQMWLFVAAGLYPHERKAVTRYAPLSILLLIAGMLFVYFLVLPWTIRFFLEFSGSIPIPQQSVTTTQPYQPVFLPQIAGDPESPRPFEMWFNTVEGRVKFRFVDAAQKRAENRVIPFSPANLLAPQITLPNYISLVIGMLLLFGLSFQLPLVVLALARIGIVEIEALKASRRYVYFVLTIVAAVITPGDVITATVALLVPLALLYELGIALAQWGRRRQTGPHDPH